MDNIIYKSFIKYNSFIPYTQHKHIKDKDKDKPYISNMRIGKYVRNYFENTETEDWNYETFNKFMKLLGYKNDEDISRTYVRLLKEIINKENTELKRNMAINLLKSLEKDINQVNVFL